MPESVSDMEALDAIREALRYVPGGGPHVPPDAPGLRDRAISAADALSERLGEANRLAQIVLADAVENDYCVACDCHPSHGHAKDCPALAASPGGRDA